MSTLVVGGAGAIGSAVVRRLRAEGLVAHALDRETGVDASDPVALQAFVDELGEPPRQLVHVAGSVGVGGLEETSLEEWRRIVDDNLTSAYVVCRTLVPSMVGRGGAVVLTSSVNGRHGGNELSGPAYAAAKAGVIALARNVAKEYGSRGVRANVVAPGPVASAMTERLSRSAMDELVATVPAGRVAEPEEVAAAICFLLGSDAQYINGAVVDINGGMWCG